MNGIEKRRVISHKNLPIRTNLQSIALIYLLLESFDVTDVIKAISWTLVAIWYILVLLAAINQEQIDLLARRT